MNQDSKQSISFSPPRWHWLYVIIAMVAVQIASACSKVSMPVDGINFDKFAHFFIFGLIATLVLRMLSLNRRGMILAILIVSAYGALDEIHQHFTPGRFAGIDDWIADTLGAIVAVLVYKYWTFYRRLLETSLTKRKASK